jgi:hypothetical protein
MNLLAFFALMIIGGPLVKALADRISRGGRIEPGSEEMRKTLQATEQRLAETENRLAAVEEKLDFYEKLLRNPEKPGSRE